jgi:hypothetical protein
MASLAVSLIDQWSDPRWRLNNLYWIENKAGEVIRFRMNWAQERLFDELWYLNVILKARQMGFSTVIQLYMLDACLFNSHTAAGTVADTRENAEAIFRTKVKVPYEHLPDQLRARISAEQNSARELLFSNGSSIRVGTSLRSGTFQYLHISEYGKICAKAPEKAKEIQTGALNTVQAGQFVFIESTAEGQAGHFKESCDRAEKMALEKRRLTPLDFRFHFFPWWRDSSYTLSDDDAAHVVITPDDAKYFDQIEAQIGRKLTTGQKAWYVKKKATQGDYMKREYPSLPKEAFEVSVEGAYFSSQMAKVRKEGRICRIPVLERPVDVYWDLGVGDAMALAFKQSLGLEERFIDYYENVGEGFAHYARVLNEKGYLYGRHYMPHDAGQRRLGQDAKSAKQHAEDAGIRPIDTLPRIASESDGIEASRAYLAKCWFDEKRCQRLVACLDSYRKEWDEKYGVFKDHARHDEFSHGYKAFEQAAIAPETSFMSKPLHYPRLATA